MTVNEMIKELQSYQKAKYGDLPIKIEGINDRDDIHSINMVVDDNNAVYIEPQNTHDIVCGLKKYTGEKHGRWFKRMSTPDSVKCSVCGNNHERPTTYCPNCGARMDLKEKKNNDR